MKWLILIFGPNHQAKNLKNIFNKNFHNLNIIIILITNNKSTSNFEKQDTSTNTIKKRDDLLKSIGTKDPTNQTAISMSRIKKRAIRWNGADDIFWRKSRSHKHWKHFKKPKERRLRIRWDYQVDELAVQVDCWGIYDHDRLEIVWWQGWEIVWF